MRSIRLDDELDMRVRQAAAAEGASVSEFIRRAASERADHTLATGASERLADVIGAVHGGGGQARDTGPAFVEALDQRP
ncbi:MAG: ribbon-helix-helix protein, CopG family [Solirubrobacteraceae bacterium]|jgi:predicted DNA-binding protein